MKKTIQLYAIYYQYLQLFPKKDKYALGATCEKYIITVIELLLAVGYAEKNQKYAILLQVNRKFEALKLFIRLLKDLKIIDMKKYITLESHIQEIGRMLGGWMKSLNPM